MDWTELDDIQVRVLGCLIEKKETTPDQYPLTLNALKNACNQKTARDPVTRYTEGEIGQALRRLGAVGLVREAWGARAAKFEHRAGPVLELTGKALAVMCVLMLRGPQTPGELKNHAHRLFAFDDLDDVHYVLGRLQAHEPPMVRELPRQPGQKEVRFAHLLAGEPALPERGAVRAVAAESLPVHDDVTRRLATLEQAVEELRERLAALESST